MRFSQSFGPSAKLATGYVTSIPSCGTELAVREGYIERLRRELCPRASQIESVSHEGRRRTLMDIVAIIVSGFAYLVALFVFLVLTSLADGSLRFDVSQCLNAVYARIQR
jgi:hypothetical protein